MALTRANVIVGGSWALQAVRWCTTDVLIRTFFTLFDLLMDSVIDVSMACNKQTRKRLEGPQLIDAWRWSANPGLNSSHLLVGFICPALANRAICADGVASPKPVDLPNAAAGRGLIWLHAVVPLQSFVGTKYVVPYFHGYSEVVMPLIVRVVHEVNGHRQPKTFRRILVLQLMGKR
jgi:hypothetical protein